jgi:hypothetical protein
VTGFNRREKKIPKAQKMGSFFENCIFFGNSLFAMLVFDHAYLGV